MDPPARQPAKAVGDAFAKDYYDHLQNSPENLYKCYIDNSKISRPGLDGAMRTSTLPDIGEDLNMLSSGGFDSVVVTSVISQDSHSGGILVVVDGYFSFKERRERNFTQTFFLAPQEKGHFVVISDMFRFVDISEAEANNGEVADETLRVSERNENNQESHEAVTEEACICVKNLPPNATVALVKNAFEHFGEIRRHGIKFHKKKKPWYCFVEFDEADAAKRAIEESPIMIDGSTCYVEKKRPDYQTTLTECSSIYLKYLPRTATIDCVEDAFKQFGPIKRGGITIITPGLNYWYGFVVFEEAAAAKRAIEASPLRIGEHTSHVEKKRPANKKIKADAVDDTENGNNQESQVVTEEAGICVKRLPPKATTDLVENAFKQFGPIKKGGITIKTPMMKYWYGFVEFEEADAAKRAVEASPVKINGKDVQVVKERFYDFWEWQKVKERESKLREEAGDTEVDHSWDYENIMEEHRKYLKENQN